MFKDLNEFIAAMEKERMLARIAARKAEDMWQKISKGWKP